MGQITSALREVAAIHDVGCDDDLCVKKNPSAPSRRFDATTNTNTNTNTPPPGSWTS